MTTTAVSRRLVLAGGVCFGLLELAETLCLAACTTPNITVRIVYHQLDVRMDQQPHGLKSTIGAQPLAADPG